MSDRSQSYQGTNSGSDSSYEVGTESNVWGGDAHHILSQVRMGEGGIQFPRISESGARNEYRAVRGEGAELGRKWRVIRPVARYLVKEFVTSGHDWKGSVGYWVGSPLVALEEEKKAWKRARSLERRIASSFNEFVPESFLLAQEALIHSQPQVPRGNRLDVRRVEKSSTGQSLLHSEGTECLALFARGIHHQTLCLASLCARGRRGGHGDGQRAETGGRDNGAHTSGENPSACLPSTTLDLHTTIHQVHLEDYTERGQGAGGGGLLYAARGKSSIFCGIVRADTEHHEAMSMRPLFDMSTKPSGLLLSSVCLNPFWPELSFGTCCGKICSVDVERAGTTAACAKYATNRARMEALKSCIVGRIRVSTGDLPVFHVYGKDPNTLVCCSNTSVFLADLRAPGDGLGCAYRHPNLCRYQGIDKDPFGSGAPHLVSLVSQEEVQIFDERYMKPLVTWRAPSQAYLVSSAMLSSPSSVGSGSGGLDFAADGVVLTSGSILSEATLYPFGGERPGNGAGGSAHVKTFFDIPRDSVFGPGMLVGHSVGGLASSRDAVDRLTLMDAVTTPQGEESRAAASSSLAGRPKVRVPDPKSCIGIKAICDPERKSFILCSLAGDLGLSISHASALADAGENDWDKGKSWRHYETIPYSATQVSTKDREGGSGRGLSNLGVSRSNAMDLTLYDDLNPLTREVNAHAPRSPRDSPATAYEILLDAPATGAVGGGANGRKETISRPHRSHMEPVGEDDAIGQALDLLSTVLDIDSESFWPPPPAPARDDGERADAQAVLSGLWREHCTQEASGLWH